MRSSARSLGMLEGGATHVGVATDHVIESFRNDLWAGYKTGDGHRSRCCSRSSRCSRTRSRALGVTVWAMVELEADDALASAARGRGRRRPRRAGDHLHPRQGPRAVRRRQGRAARPAPARSCATPTACARSSACRRQSIPDWLALVGDSADGFPGLPGWGAKTAAAVLAPLRAPRGDSRRREGLGRPGRARRRPAGGDARRGPRGRGPVQGARDAAHRRRRRRASTTGDGPGRRRRSPAWCERFGSPGLARRVDKLAQRRAQ